MKRSMFSEAQVSFILRQVDEGATVGEVCRKAGISEATFYVWRKKYAGLMPSEMKRLRLTCDPSATGGRSGRSFASKRARTMTILSPTDLVGTFAALCSMSSFTPQIIKIWQTKDATSVSLRMYVVTVTGFMLWITYGVLIESWPVAVSNAVCLALSGAILGLKWRFRENRN